MGVVYTVLLPLILLIGAVAFISPLIGLACVVAAALSTVVLVLAARKLVRARRGWVRTIGAVLIPIAALAILTFTTVAVVSFVIAVNFYGAVLFNQ